MTQKEPAAGMLHPLPADLRDMLLSTPEACATWEDITPLARNEWICWIDSARKEETRTKRLERTRADLTNGKHRPCCWPGCRIGVSLLIQDVFRRKF